MWARSSRPASVSVHATHTAAAVGAAGGGCRSLKWVEQGIAGVLPFIQLLQAGGPAVPAPPIGSLPSPPAWSVPAAGVAARVLKVDRAAGRLSLGLKPSYFADLSDQEAGSDEEGGEPDFDADLEAAMEAEGPGSEVGAGGGRTAKNRAEGGAAGGGCRMIGQLAAGLDLMHLE